MSQLEIRPLHKLQAEFSVPGDKSISHRGVMFGGIAHGTTRIRGFLPGEDCLSTLHAFQALGARIDRLAPDEVVIEGRNGQLLAPSEAIDCGNSGTTMRLLAGILSAQPFTTRLFGDASLSRRPMARITEPLRLFGAEILCEGKDDRPPLNIRGSSLKATTFRSHVASAQVKSCVLLAALFARGKTDFSEPSLSRDHTERLLPAFGATFRREKNHLIMHGPQRLEGTDLEVPGDFSSGAFWIVLAAGLPGARLTLRRLGLNPTRTALLSALLRMGAGIVEKVEEPLPEPMGTVYVEGGQKLRATSVGGKEIPALIDEIPILAAAAALAQGITEIRDAAELRHKESDRLAVMAKNLRLFGVPVEERPDGLAIEGGRSLVGAEVESHGDHRIAMSCAILGLLAKGRTVVKDTDCIETSYPGFAKQIALLQELGR
ncbi:MAG: 3-phosphoshikimate 1-carboxyvinyltransferase [Verrucomicrobia bacterium]|nr:3-phosphoshikimate 1-carboxyvinyltransferase [Verrucomicrobiota bacterium]